MAELAPLGFGQADLVIAVPAVWIDVETVDDLDAAAAEFRKAHGHRLRIATKYHRLVRDFLQAQGVADYQLVDSQGATEGTVKNRTAEAIADITSSGETLRANHLRILSDGLIHSSQAVLWAVARGGVVGGGPRGLCGSGGEAGGSGAALLTAVACADCTQPYRRARVTPIPASAIPAQARGGMASPSSGQAKRADSGGTR